MENNNNIFEAIKFTWDKYSNLANIFITFSSGTALLIINSSVGKTLDLESKHSIFIAVILAILSSAASSLWIFVIHFFTVVELFGKRDKIDKYYKDAGILDLKVTNNYEKILNRRYRFFYKSLYYLCPALSFIFLSASWLFFLKSTIKF